MLKLGFTACWLVCLTSTGVGMTKPDPALSYTTDDGVIIPLGPGIKGDIAHSSLLYNEYPLCFCVSVRVYIYIQ